MAELLDLDAGNFTEEVLEEKGAVLVDFWSPTCSHCLKLAPAFAAAAEQLGSRAKFVKVSVADARPLFSEYGVAAVPTLILFRDGERIPASASTRLLYTYGRPRFNAPSIKRCSARPWATPVFLFGTCGPLRKHGPESAVAL